MNTGKPGTITLYNNSIIQQSKIVEKARLSQEKNYASKREKYATERRSKVYRGRIRVKSLQAHPTFKEKWSEIRKAHHIMLTSYEKELQKQSISIHRVMLSYSKDTGNIVIKYGPMRKSQSIVISPQKTDKTDSSLKAGSSKTYMQYIAQLAELNDKFSLIGTLEYRDLHEIYKIKKYGLEKKWLFATESQKVVEGANELLTKYFKKRLRIFEDTLFSEAKQMTKGNMDKRSYLIFCNKKCTSFDSLTHLENEAYDFVEEANKLQAHVASSLGLR